MQICYLLLIIKFRLYDFRNTTSVVNLLLETTVLWCLIIRKKIIAKGNKNALCRSKCDNKLCPNKL